MHEVRRFGLLNPSIVLLAEHPSFGRFEATADQPFAPLITDETLVDLTLEDWIDQQATIVDAVLLPTGHLGAGQRPALRSIIETANTIDRDNVILPIVADPRWLVGPDLLKLIHWINQSKQPVAICFSSKENPLSSLDFHRGYRRLFTATGAFAWRADHAGLDAFAHGALGAAIGVIPSLRKATPPGEENHAWNPKDKRPHMVHPDLMRYARTSELENWYVGHEINCACIVCYGRSLVRLGSSEIEKAEGERHNAVYIASTFEKIRTAAHKPSTWRGMRENAVGAHEALALLTNRNHPVEAGLRHWAEMDDADQMPAPQPSENSPL
jgi:hypothetical protein